ncbi:MULTISPECIES: response regulator transcription factor [Eubacterium]|uniref:Stage 0 sporulation protein A homolog n=4 Tax=Eubacterium TaxID=1730 RepID=A0ABT2LYY6_9FIRM|nr:MULTISPECIES: response regulator transcription factor [unclassified Eubacterium (in: firmicutes)]MCT7398088.1 response regulator transcription factor [Eubacterium sp. LFL-14]RGG67323.1 DNA-binding response regulator [Eubacterium sp. AF17-7]CDA28638.1 response regulator with CheY-like receiver domain and winged-helix DNA-binding domain [Eubacterium sp. CAG:156]
MSELIYIADDEKNIRELVKCFLENQGYEVETFSNGDDLFKRYKEKNADMIILDVIMPGTDGVEICRQIRQIANVPIIILSAKDSEEDRIKGISVGGDDYLTKPFSPIELVARVQALFRRISMDKVEKVEKVTFGNIKIDVTKKQAYVDDEEIALTPLEFDFLKYLIQKNNQAISREELLKEVWKIAYDIDTRATDDTVKRLRRKIADSNVEIKTVWGYGFKMALKK